MQGCVFPADVSLYVYRDESRGPQQAEILDTDAEIRAEILLEIRDPKSQAIFFRLFP